MSFSDWQADYAARRIATFPVDADKKPMVRHYGRFGLASSRRIADRFAGAPAIGFMCGPRSGVTVLDVDTNDERVLADAVDRHGRTPIIARSGSGNFQAWYRHAGERRLIRPRRDVPIDILGAGFVVAPPSKVAKGSYQFIQGSLDDLESLPTLNDAPAFVPDMRGMRQGDGRNNRLFKLGLRHVKSCDDFDQLLDWCRTQNDFCAQPMEDKEVMGIAQNVWRYESNGLNRVGRFGAYFPIEEINKLVGEPDDLCLLAFLRAHNHPDSTFMVANGLAKRLGWCRERLVAARRRLIQARYLTMIRQAGQHTPALYRWGRQGYGYADSPDDADFLKIDRDPWQASASGHDANAHSRYDDDTGYERGCGVYASDDAAFREPSWTGDSVTVAEDKSKWVVDHGGPSGPLLTGGSPLPKGHGVGSGPPRYAVKGDGPSGSGFQGNQHQIRRPK
jgi:hypothetical protein